MPKIGYVVAYWQLPTRLQRGSGVGADFENFAAVAVRPDHNELNDVYRITIYKGGWPYHSLGAERRIAFTSAIYEWQRDSEWRDLNLRLWLRSQSDERPLPLKPLWPGFAINTLFYATLLWLLIGGPFVLRRTLRLRRGLYAGAGICEVPVTSRLHPSKIPTSPT